MVGWCCCSSQCSGNDQASCGKKIGMCTTFHSGRGEQGDLLMPLLFNLAQHAALVTTQEQLRPSEFFFAFTRSCRWNFHHAHISIYLEQPYSKFQPGTTNFPSGTVGCENLRNSGETRSIRCTQIGGEIATHFVFLDRIPAFWNSSLASPPVSRCSESQLLLHDPQSGIDF